MAFLVVHLCFHEQSHVVHEVKITLGALKSNTSTNAIVTVTFVTYLMGRFLPCAFVTRIITVLFTPS